MYSVWHVTNDTSQGLIRSPEENSSNIIDFEFFVYYLNDIIHDSYPMFLVPDKIVLYVDTYTYATEAIHKASHNALSILKKSYNNIDFCIISDNKVLVDTYQTVLDNMKKSL